MEANLNTRLEQEIEELACTVDGIGTSQVLSPDGADEGGAAAGPGHRAVLRIQVLPLSDLWISNPVNYEITVPAHWPSSPPVVRCLGDTDDVLPSGLASHLDEHRVVRLATLTEREGWSRSYTLSVLFFAVRSLHRDSPQTPWMPQAKPWLPVPASTLPTGLHFGFELAHHAERGRRRSMEDTFVVCYPLSLTSQHTSKAMIVSLFDGHAGDACAQFARTAVPTTLAALLSKGLSWRKALHRTFMEVDERFAHLEEKNRTHAGCTACCVLFDGVDRLFAANLGDCRMVICRGDGTAKELTFDCRADRPDEIARVSAAGGFVSNRRINGQLAVSRALGDQDYKRMMPLVSAEPEITELCLEEDDRFFVLACDGLWDVMTSNEVMAFVRERIQPLKSVASDASPPSVEQNELQLVAEELVRYAINERGSTDNVSAIIGRITSATASVPWKGPDSYIPHAQATSFATDFGPLTAQQPSSWSDVAPFTRDSVHVRGSVIPARGSDPFGGGGGGAFAGASAEEPQKHAADKKTGGSGGLVTEDKELMDFLMNDSNFK